MDVATAHSDNIFLNTLIVVLLCKVLRNDLHCVNILVFMYFECLILWASASIFHHKSDLGKCESYYIWRSASNLIMFHDSTLFSVVILV